MENEEEIKIEKQIINSNSFLKFLNSSRIKLYELISSGSYGKIYRCKYLNLNLVVKETFKKDSLREIKCLSKLKTNFSPCFYGLSEFNDKYRLLIEKINGVDLEELIFKSHKIFQKYIEEKIIDEGNTNINLKTNISSINKGGDIHETNKNMENTDNFFRNESKIMFYFYLLIISIEISSSLNFLHEMNLIHKDIKPRNIMITKNYGCKIVDYGLSIFKSDLNNDDIISEREGTFEYSSPEQNLFESDLNDSNNSNCSDSENKPNRITSSTDIWSLGICFNYLFSNEKPWSNNKNIINKSMINKIPYNISSKIELEFISETIKACLNYDKGNRPSATNIQDDLAYFFHKFLSDILLIGQNLDDSYTRMAQDDKLNDLNEVNINKNQALNDYSYIDEENNLLKKPSINYSSMTLLKLNSCLSNKTIQSSEKSSFMKTNFFSNKSNKDQSSILKKLLNHPILGDLLDISNIESLSNYSTTSKIRTNTFKQDSKERLNSKLSKFLLFFQNTFFY